MVSHINQCSITNTNTSKLTPPSHERPVNKSRPDLVPSAFVSSSKKWTVRLNKYQENQWHSEKTCPTHEIHSKRKKTPCTDKKLQQSCWRVHRWRGVGIYFISNTFNYPCWAKLSNFLNLKCNSAVITTYKCYDEDRKFNCCNWISVVVAQLSVVIAKVLACKIHLLLPLEVCRCSATHPVSLRE